MNEWLKKRAAIMCITCAVVGWMAHGALHSSKPVNRPVLTWIARAAKTALLFFFFADPPPPPSGEVQHPMADGSLPVDHGRAI
jgi:hypothetical protein